MEESKLQPQLRFPGFESVWEEKRLAEISEGIVSGKTKPSNNGKYPVYGSMGIIGVCHEPTHNGSYLLIARVGANAGSIRKVDGQFSVTDNTLIFEVKESFSIEYVFQKLSSYNLNRLVFGSGQPLVTAGQLKNLELFFPYLEEQQKIATFLTTVDKRITLLTQKKEKLEQYKKGVMQKIFNREIRFKDENGNDFPEWEEKRLGEIANIYQPKTISQNELTEDGFFVYGANGIIGKYSQYNHEKEQIAITCRGNTCGTVNYTQAYSWITGNAMVINIDDQPMIFKKYMYYTLVNSNLKYLITGSGQPQITGDIKKHRVFICDLEEQQKIATFLTAIDQQIEQVRKQIDSMKVWKKGLLQQMFV